MCVFLLVEFGFDRGWLIKMLGTNWRVLALSCLSSVYGNDQAEGFLNLEPQTEHEYMENKSNSFPAFAPKRALFPRSWFFFSSFFPSFSTILIYLLTLQTVPVIFSPPRFLHWFSVQLILNQLVLVDLVTTWNLEHFAAHRPGLRIRDHVDGNGGQEKEQQVPGCCNARARPPGGNNRHAAERDGARCPGHRQGNACINTSAATIRAKALGSPVIKPPSPLLENGILPVWQKLVWNYWLEQGCNVFDLLMCVWAEANVKQHSSCTATYFRVQNILCTSSSNCC